MAAAEATNPSLISSLVVPEQYVLAGGTTLLNAEAAAIWEQALTQASACLAGLLTRADRDTLLNEVFGRAGTEATVFEANRQALLEAIGTTGLRIAIDLRNNTEMEGAIGAYAQVGPNGNEIILINADWIIAGNLSLEQLTAVVLEEYGHALDVRLNPGLESAGDEGELFANLITNAGLNADQIAAINTQNDWGTVQVDGQTVAVELATFTMTTGTDNPALTTGADQVTVSATGQIQAADTINAQGGTDTIIVGATISFTSAATNGTAGFLSFEEIRFSGVSTATFNAAQFGTGKISTTSQFTGAAGIQGVTINLAAGATFDASGFTFASWTAGTDRFSLAGSTGTETITGSSERDFIGGDVGNYSLNGGANNDTITGGNGADTLTGGSGTDQFNYQITETALTINGATGTVGTISGFDVISDYASNPTAASAERIVFNSSVAVLADTTTGNGIDSTLILESTSATVKTHAIANGMITFDDATAYASAVSLTSFGDVAAVV
jgi:Ca2+-binding RTX toxin-like protein